jgi:hypothetical protein
VKVTDTSGNLAPGAEGYLARQSRLGHVLSLFLTKLKGPRPEGKRSVDELGYHRYVGGYWDQLGLLQFEFLKKQGLQPNHVFLDIACGSLRGGRFFIPYLDPGNYLAVEKEATLVEAGRQHEITPEV